MAVVELVGYVQALVTLGLGSAVGQDTAQAARTEEAPVRSAAHWRHPVLDNADPVDEAVTWRGSHGERARVSL